MKFAITIEYLGTNYSGWQRQDGCASIQEELEEALSKLCDEKITIYGSGRTDAGVHAYGQVAHFFTNSVRTPRGVMLGVNTLLPNDIRVVESHLAEEGFHAQYSATSKTYIYKCYLSPTLSPLRHDRAVQIRYKIDIEKMKRCAAKLVGTHDFAAFSSVGSTVLTTARTIFSLELRHIGDSLEFEVEGNGFLYNMVRIIVGTLLFVGKGKLPEDTIERMLVTKDRSLGGKTYPSYGLYLKKVTYN